MNAIQDVLIIEYQVSRKEFSKMYAILIYLMALMSFLILVLVVMQPAKQQDALSLFSGDNSSALFSNQRRKGIGSLLQYLTGIIGVAWVILGIVLTYLSK